VAQSYTRQSTFVDGDTITAALFNNEYNQLVNAFTYSSSSASSTGHRHDGTAGHGGNIHTIGDLDFLNKIVADSTNNRWGFFVEVSSAAVEQIRLSDGVFTPVTDSDVDLGTSSLYWKNAYIDSITTTGNVAVGGNLTVTGNATISGNLTFGDAASDTVAFSADVASNLLPSADNTYDIGASGSEWKDLYIDGTANIDSLVADTADINGGTIDGAIIGGSSAAAITGTAITGTSFVIGSADISEAELETIDGVTAGTVAASKAVVVDSNKDIGSFRNITLTGELDAGSLDVSGDVDIDGTLETDALSINSTAVTSTAAELNILDGVTSTAAELNILDGVTSTAAELNILDGVTATASEINTLDGITSTVAELNILDGVTASATDINLIDGITNGTVIASKAIITDANKDITGGRNITISGELDAATLDISGDADIDGTLEADAITIGGVTLAETISDTVGAMVSSNTETNITVSYVDDDNTLDFVIGTLNQDTTGTADNITVSANNSTDETVYPIFVDGATGSQGAESDTGLTYNPSTGVLTSTSFTGNLTGNVTGNTSGTAATVTGAAQSNITSLGTLTTLTVDNVIVNGTTIGHTSDTDLITLADGNVTIAGELDLTTLDVSGNADIDGTLEADAITVDGTALNEYIADTVGAMVGSNTETGITVTYEDGDNTLDFVIGTLNQNTTGNAATATLASTVTVSDSTANTNFPVVFHDESNALLDDTGALRYNPSTGELLVPKLTVAGTTTTADTVTMEASNAIIFEGATADSNETTLSIVDPTSDHTQYLINQGGYIPVLAAATTTAITSTPAELNILDGVTSTATELNLLDGSTANTVVNSKAVIYGSSGELAGTLSTAAQTNITSLGTLTALTGGTGDFNWDSNTLVVDSSANRVGIGNASPDVSLDAGSNTDAIHIPSGTTAQRPGSPAAGYFRYNSTTGDFEGYTDAWGAIAGSGGGTAPAIDTMTGDGSDTTLTLTSAPANENATVVTIDGVVQHKSTYSVSGNTLTFSEAPPDDTAVECITWTNTAVNSALLMQDADGDTQIQVEESSDEDKIRFDTGGTERMIIDSTGLGIGTSSPSANIHIYSTADNKPHLLLENFQNADTDDAPIIELYTNDQTTGGIGDDTDVGVIRFTGDEKDAGGKETYAEIRGVAHDPGSGSSNKGNLSFFVQAAGDLHETLTLDEKNVGIGIASPSDELHVKGGSSSAFIRVDNSADGHDTGFNIYQNGSRKWEIHSDDSNTDALDFRPGGTSKFTMMQDGKFGIGTTSPASLIDIIGSTGDQIRIQSSKSDNTAKTAGIVSTMYTNNTVSILHGSFANGNNTIFYGSNDTNHRGIQNHVFYVNAGYNATSSHTEAVRITSEGDFYIGTDTVQGQGGCTFDHGTRGINQTFNQSSHVDDNEFVTFRNENTQIGSITAPSSSSIAYNTSSDYRLKENVDYTWDATTRLKQLKPARFNWIADDTNTLEDGFLAHEVQTVVPNAITGTKDQMEDYVDDEGNTQQRMLPQKIDQSKLVPLLVKTIQELEARITALES
jgi:cytoskeletal protein CcmA (bactofilin family)